MNILFLNVGRRCELVECFKNALKQRGGGKVYGSDISPLAPGLQVVDESVIFPHGDSPEFKEHLAKFCREYDIHLVIPTIDPDLVRLNKIRDYFDENLPHCRLLLSSEFCIEHARNKNLSKKLMMQLGAHIPNSISLEKDNWTYPIFVRPYDGSSGIGALKIEDSIDLQYALKKNDHLMIEEFIPGEEYTVDVLCDFNGKAIIAIPRRRIKIRAGEVVQGIVERNEKIEQLAMHLAEGFQSVGPVTVQFRCTEKNKIVAIELNARMGGGLPLSIAAGADWPGWILDLCNHVEPVISTQIMDKLIMTRCDKSFYMSEDVLNLGVQSDSKGKASLNRLSFIKDIKAWIFDLDDTLYPERDFVFNGYRAVSEKVFSDYKIDIEHELQEMFLNGARGDLFTKVLKQYDVIFNEEYVKKLVHIYRFNSGIIKPYIEVIPLLEKLQSMGKKIGLVSDGWFEVQKSKFEKLHLESYFNSIIFTDSLNGTATWKPSTLGYERCLKELNISPNQAIYIGDNDRKDFIGAKQIGMRTVKVCRKGAVHQISRCSDEFRADIEFHSLAELLKVF